MKLKIPALTSFLLLLSAAFWLNGCQKEISSESNGFIQAPTEKTINATIEGQVYDENGAPMANAQVSIGTVNGTTDKYGFFRFNGASINQNGGLVKVIKAGYFNGSRSLFYSASETNFVRIQMIPKTLVGTIDAAAGGSVSVSTAGLSLPANGVAKAASGTAFSGTINVYAAYLDPSLESTLKQMPGNLFGIQANNTLASLESYGMMAVELESTSGEKLQIANGSEATLSFPAPASAAQTTIPLWYFDEATGFWKEEGMATKTGNQYIGKVKHFSFWNCDYPYGVVDFQVKIVDQNNNPLVHKMVRIETTTGNASAGSGYTDSLGRVSGKMPKNQVLTLKAMGDCNNVIHTQSIGPYSAAANLGTITVTVSAAQMVEITGTVVDCSSIPVSNGYAYLTLSNRVYRCHTNNTGGFTIRLMNCSGATTASIFGIDLTNLQEGVPVSINIGSTAVNAGNIAACGTLIQNFINYTIDGVSYSLTNPPDSTMAYFTTLNGTTNPPPTTYISGFKIGATTPNPRIDFSFSGTATTTGTHTLTAFSANGVDSATIPSPILLTITQYGAVAEFIVGSFAGTVNSSSGIHTITANFRVRRLQ
ncbi:MAG: carboxypeptidase-like regulatory domain-containing protein [Bacteroidota bacterium]